MHERPQVVGCADQLLDFTAVALEVLRQHVSAEHKRKSFMTCALVLVYFWTVLWLLQLRKRLCQTEENIYLRDKKICLKDTGSFKPYRKDGRCLDGLWARVFSTNYRSKH